MTTQDPNLTTLVAFTTAYVIIFLVALFGNFLVIYIVISRAHVRTRVNNLLANMAAADLLVALFIIPDSMKFMYLKSKWFGGPAGEMFCKVIPFLYAVPISASIFSLIFVTIDQFFAVLFPFKTFKLFRNFKAITIFIWVCSSALMIPYGMAFWVRKGPSGTFQCLYDWSPLTNTMSAGKIQFLLIFLFLYQLPLIFISILYVFIARKLWFRKIPGNINQVNERKAKISKQKVVRMLVIIIAIFAICWLPIHVFHLIVFYGKLTPSLTVSLLLAFVSHMNSAINPSLYMIMNTSFRRELFSIYGSTFCVRYCCIKPRSVADEPTSDNNENKLLRLQLQLNKHHFTRKQGSRDMVDTRQDCKLKVMLTHYKGYDNPVSVTGD